MRVINASQVSLMMIGLLHAAAPLAQETGDSGAQADPAQIETITITASRRERPVREVANSVSITEAERIQETLAMDIKDLARHTPWLSVSNDPARFGAAGFTIRGIDANRVATEIDGVPVADSFGVGSYSSARRDLVNPVMVKRLEVLRGPASSLYGSDAIGGVVSYSTWQPGDLLARTSRNWATGLNMGYRSSDDGLHTSISAAAGEGPLQGMLIMSRRSGNETENTALRPAARPNPQDYERSDVLARLVRSVDGIELGLTAELRHAQVLTEVNNLEGQGRFANTTLLAGNDRQTRRRISVNGEFQRGGRFVDSVAWQLYYQESMADQRTVEERRASSRAPSPTVRFPSFAFTQSTIGADVSATHDTNGPNVSHSLLYGAQFRYSRAEELRDNLLINLDDGTETKTVLGETFPVRDFPDSRIIEAAVFAHDEIMLNRERLTLIPAIRFEYYKLQPRPDEVYRADNPLGEVVSIGEMNVSPKLGLVYHLDKKASVFAQYARGFRSPPFEDANIGLDIPLFNVRAIPNPDLRPETSDGFEAGLRVSGTRLRGTLSAFISKYADFIETKVNLGPDEDTGVLIFQSLNRERARIYGWELELGIELDRWMPGFAMNSAIAVTRGEDRSRNLPLNSIDPARAVLGLTFDHPSQRWGGELLASFARGKSRVDESALDLFQPPGYGILDLLAYMRISDRATLNVGLFNLAGKRYWDWADVRGRPADDPLIELYTRPGFSLATTLRMEW